MTDPLSCPRERLESLRRSLSARAVGWWTLEGEDLVQQAFVAAADLPAEVAARFAAATRSVGSSQTSLGIVKAVVESGVVVSRAWNLPAEYGSGHWLRCFGADRSVAVPCLDSEGRVQGVVSAALVGDVPADEAVVHEIRDWATIEARHQYQSRALDRGPLRPENGQ